MSTSPSFDFAKPYDIMCGVWAGMACIYSPKGEYQFAAPSRVAIYWKDRSTLHYRQDEMDNLDAFMDRLPRGDTGHAQIRHVVHASFDLTIDGKAAAGRSSELDVTGTETMPGVYLFRLAVRSGGVYYNNQYFLDASQRNIIGPFVGADGETSLVIAQSFARISYDVPESFRSELAEGAASA
jgi:hypothetical protein